MISPSNKSIDIEWSKSLGMIIDTIMFVSPELLTNTDDIVKTFDKLSKLGETSDNFKTLADSIRYVANSLKDIDTGVIDNLSKFSGSMLVLSLVDETKLTDLIDVFDDRKNDLRDIISFGNMGDGSEEDVKTSSITQIITKTDKEDQKHLDEKFDTLISEIQSLKGILSSIDGNVDISKIMNSPNKTKMSVPFVLGSTNA